MLVTPLEIQERRRRVLAECKEQQLDQEETGKRLLEVDPNLPAGLLALGTARLVQGDLDAAEPLLWRALEGAPSNPGYYFPLMGLYRARKDQELAERFAELTWWKLSFYEEIPAKIAAVVAKHLEALGISTPNPETYRELAEELSKGVQEWPERLLPYPLLNEVQRREDRGLTPELVGEILDHAEACLPVFQSAIRESFDSDVSTLWSDPAATLLALLGEIGGPELIDVLVLLPDDEPDFFYHAQWAVWRLCQRFPEQAFERLRMVSHAPSASTRATIAQQLYLLEDAPGARAAILALLDGFAALAHEEEAWYLLLTVSTLMSMRGSVADSLAVLKRWERHLSKDGRRTLNETREGDGFVPDLLGMEIDELDIQAVCCDRALMDDDEHDDEDDDSDFEDDEDYVEPERVEKPGRNDPCWCGSGKKYKKCHLPSDEEQARSASADDRLTQDAWRQMLKFAGKFHSNEEVDRALRLYFDRDPSELDARMVADSGYPIWYILEYHATPATPTAAEEFLRRRGAQLGEPLRAFVASLVERRLGFWEIRRVQHGKGIEVVDAFGGDSLFVDAPAAAETGDSGDFVFGHVHHFAGTWRFAGDELVVRGELAARLRQEIERGSGEAGVPPAEWFRSESYQWWRFLVETSADLEADLE